MPEDRRSYIVVRDDGFVVHTVPVTEREAWWLCNVAYFEWFVGRGARARYLAEWGNVLDVGEYLERLERLDVDPYDDIAGVYRGFGELMDDVGRLLDDLSVDDEAAQAIEELARKISKFLRRPVRPTPIVAPVRYLEQPHPHVRLGSDGAVEEAELRPEWYAYKEIPGIYGISVFGREFWLWRQRIYGDHPIQAIVVRRDASERDLVAAVTSDGAVQEFLRENVDDLRELIREREAELASRGYGDVARKAKVVLATYDLLKAGRREEEGEALTA